MGRGRKNRCARERGRETMTDKFSTTPVEFRGIWIAVTASKNHRSLVAHFCSAFRSTPLPNSSRGTIKISGSGSALACPLYITSGGSQKPRSIPREKSKNRASEGGGGEARREGEIVEERLHWKSGSEANQIYERGHIMIAFATISHRHPLSNLTLLDRPVMEKW